MKAIDIADTVTLISAAGPRDFGHVFNNGDDTIFLDYDGRHGSIVTSEVFALHHGGSPGSLFPISVTLPVGTDMTQFEVGMIVTVPNSNFPVGGVTVDSVNEGTRTLGCTGNTDQYGDGTSNNVIGHKLYASYQLTVDNGMPLPPGATMVLDKAFHRYYDKGIWAIANTGKTVEVRTQGI